MEVSVNFAKPVGPYDMVWNKCVSTFCHVEMSMVLEKQTFYNIANKYIPESYINVVSRLTKETKHSSSVVHVCFYILWGGVVSLRFLNEHHEDPLCRPPNDPIYTCVKFHVSEKEMSEIVGFNLQQLGKEYDIPRAILLLTTFPMPLTEEVPSKYFCSQLVLHSLKCVESLEVEKLPNINHMSPLDVYIWLTDGLTDGLTDCL